MALPTLDATFASSADLPRKQMLAKWLVSQTGETFPSNVLVSGLQGGGAYVPDGPNGLYTYVGEENGKPKYEYVAQNEEPENPIGTFILKWEPNYGDPSEPSWLIIAPSTDLVARAYENTTYPWQSTVWESWDVGSGSPIVTESPAPSALSNYYSLPERYLWAKIAVAAGGPKTEADYISLPKNYAWSDIYNAVSGDIAQSTVAVSGLGDSQYNGNYVYNGQYNGKPSYQLSIDATISWESTEWVINISGDFARSLSDVAYPWLATGWFNDGLDPTNLVLTPKTPNHTDWTEKQALGHIAAAYRGDTGNPANLATYIDWPWRYKVASIIVSL